MSFHRVDSVLEDPASKQRPPMSLADLCEDVILIIFDHLDALWTEHGTAFKDLSCTNHYFRRLLTPRLFKTLSINQPISQLMPTRILRHAQVFKIDMFGSMWWWCSGSYTSSADAVELFQYIRALPRLKTLEISMMKRSLDMFDAAFESPGHDLKEFMLPRIEHLVVNSSAAFLASHCPRLKTLVLRDSEDCLLDSYTDVAKRLVPLHPSIASCASEVLIQFDATAIWCPEELSRLVRAFPRLQYLRMRTDTYCYRASTPDIIETLSEGLDNLQSLHLVKSGNLNMGYQSVWKRRIPASSDEEYRRALWLENERLRVSVENTVARLAFREIVALNEIWLGEKRVARRMRKDSDDGLKWLWEREREGVDTCGMATGAFLRFKVEKEAVVVTSEIGR